MAEGTDTTTTMDAPQAPADPSATETPADDLGDAGKKALEAERRARKAAEKAANELTARLKEFEDRDKTEAQKLAERAAAAEKAAADAARDLLRMQVIAEVGLDADLHEFVTGDTEDEIRAKAEKLKARSGGGEQSSSSQPGPRPDLSQGARSGAMALNGDPLLNSVKSVLGIR